ncbi:MAG: dTDP-4-dehydrorhamnose reductase [Candidatus Gastranaerophilales bacterium]|nr:dTDP-4-dehydrorhamnose reductase [Candidatus Gastranaerophilales bacterium]
MNYMNIKKVLITGSNGMLGQDLSAVLEDEGYEVIETTRATLDVVNFEQVKNVLTKYNPDCVIHCAAYTNVDGAESDLETATLVNAKGTENIAKVCTDKDILLIYISTDYVFDGTKNEPYIPSDKPNPLNNYGKTKLEGEKAVQKYCKKYYITRTSWLYGHYGKNFVETMISLADKPEIKVVDDQIGCPTWTVELSSGIAKLLNQMPEFGIYHICGSGETSWYEFAKEIFRLTGQKVNLKPCKTEEFPRPAKRPLHSTMNNQGICRNWKAAIKDYINLR